MREDLSPFQRTLFMVFGNAVAMVGAIVQIAGMLVAALTVFEILTSGWREGMLPGGMGRQKIAGTMAWFAILAGVQIFGSIMTEFGLLLLRGRLPVRHDKLLRWWICRYLLFQSATLAVFLVFPAGFNALLLRGIAVPFASGAFICGCGARYFHRRAEAMAA